MDTDLILGGLQETGISLHSSLAEAGYSEVKKGRAAAVAKREEKETNGGQSDFLGGQMKGG